MKRRKHRVVVEITLDEPCTEKKATWFVNSLIEFCENRARAGSSVGDGITKIGRTKQFSRVVQHEIAAVRKEERAFFTGKKFDL
jgi:hypothetical protein